MFEVHDLAIATWLELCGHHCERIEPDASQPNRAVFLFSDAAELEELITTFKAGEARADIQRFKALEGVMRTRMFAGLGKDSRK